MAESPDHTRTTLLGNRHLGAYPKLGAWGDHPSRPTPTKPVIEHYACMIDLLGRAGRLSNAMDFILGSPYAESSLLWRTLVNACKLNGDLNIGRVASKRLLELDSRICTSYILVSNMYAASGVLDKAAEARKM
ncbi:hypothetical protein Sjap_013802 [Stephania japonica]|uniref:Pentatricopeptide repeat-containing protein n=1 Tax=Stephania japonica TaxID=461633 RepID=A0AAP0IZT3_9MAGN